jgi:hypothetical protein
MTPEPHEGADLDAREVLRGGLIVLGLIAFSVLASWLYLALLGGKESNAVRFGTRSAPSPALEAHPQEALAEYRAAEAARFSGYRWLDRTKGIVQMPIEAAMRTLASEHAPNTSEPGTPPHPAAVPP